MRFIILLLLLGIGIVFFLQNQQLVTLVFFGNVATVTLPIAVWVLSFIGLGILTSVFWQVLSALGRPSTPQRYSARQSRPYSSPPPSPTPRTAEIPSDNRQAQQDFVRPSSATQPSNVNPKDYEEEWDDWENETPKREPVREFVREFPRDRLEIEPKDEPIDNSERFSSEDKIDLERPSPEDNANLFEMQQQPKTSTRTGSVYSYVYREPKDRQDRPPMEDKKPDTKEDKRDRVYDADYRVIRPPYQPPPEQPKRDIEDDEDWI